MTTFHDYIQGPGATSAAEANETSLGTLTLPKFAGSIRKIWVSAVLVGTYAVNKPLLGYVKIESDDMAIEPLHIPLECVGSYLSLGHPGYAAPHKWPVNCAFPAGAIVEAIHVADEAPNAAPEITVCFEFTDARGRGPQRHMKSGEPNTALSTSDNGESNLSNITIRGARRIVGFFGYAVYTTVVADTGVIGQFDVKSDEFLKPGPHKFPCNPNMGGDANAVGGMVDGITVVMCEEAIELKPGVSDAVIKTTFTIRDAVSTAPDGNIGVVYE